MALYHIILEQEIKQTLFGYFPNLYCYYFIEYINTKKFIFII